MPLKEDKNGTEQIAPISDPQKIDLFNLAITQLEEKLMMISAKDEANASATKYHFEVNISTLIEEVCVADPENGVNTVQNIIQELLALFSGQDLSNLSQKEKDILLGKLLHNIKIKLSPLLIKKMERLNNVRLAENYKQFFKEDQEMFLRDGFGSLMSINNEDIPHWFSSINSQKNYETLIQDSVFDPEAAKILKDIRDQASKELRGTPAALTPPETPTSSIKPTLRRVK